MSARRKSRKKSGRNSSRDKGSTNLNSHRSQKSDKMAKNTFFGESDQTWKGVTPNVKVTVNKKGSQATGTRKRKIDTKIKKFDEAVEKRAPSMKNLEALAQLHSGERGRNSNSRQSYMVNSRASMIGSRASMISPSLNKSVSPQKHQRRANRFNSRMQHGSILDQSSDNLLNQGNRDSQVVNTNANGSIIGNNIKEVQEEAIEEDGPQNKGDSKYFTIFLYTIIFLSIFGDDLRMLFFTKKQDKYFDYVLIGLMVLFLLEALYRMIKDGQKYICSSAFAMDLIATSSILLDLSYITNKLNSV